MFFKLRLNLALKTALLWVVVDHFGFVVDGCGWLWMVVGRFGWFLVLVTTHDLRVTHGLGRPFQVYGAQNLTIIKETI